MSNRNKIYMFCLASLVLCPEPGMVFGQKLGDKYAQQRHKMVDLYIAGAGVKDERVLASMRATRRREFMPRDVRDQAYYDAGIPIGEGQTISSPFIVAYMTESLDTQPEDKVLEIGTGSGYQAAVLSPLVKEVYTIEIVESLGKQAAKTLKKLNYDNVHAMIGDGYKGWPEHAPFDKIIVTCSPEDVPQPLVDQLKDGGLMIVPMGERHQQTLYLLRKKGDELVAESLRPTLFVPMTGAAEDARRIIPDPNNPALLNGDFEEEVDNKDGFVPGWYYQRQMKLVKDQLAPSGFHYVEFSNNSKHRPAHLMQGFAIDGNEVEKIKMSASVKCNNVVAGDHQNDLPMVALSFYDQDRRMLGTTYIGRFRGSRGWKRYQQEVRVPDEAAEAILRIGMFGATGSAAFDDVRIKKIK